MNQNICEIRKNLSLEDGISPLSKLKSEKSRFGNQKHGQGWGKAGQTYLRWAEITRRGATEGRNGA